jgi:hypothetical protein
MQLKLSGGAFQFMSICLTTGHEVSAPPVTNKRRRRFWHSATAGMRVAVLKPEIPAHTTPPPPIDQQSYHKICKQLLLRECVYNQASYIHSPLCISQPESLPNYLVLMSHLRKMSPRIEPGLRCYTIYASMIYCRPGLHT